MLQTVWHNPQAHAAFKQKHCCLPSSQQGCLSVSLSVWKCSADNTALSALIYASAHLTQQRRVQATDRVVLDVVSAPLQHTHALGWLAVQQARNQVLGPVMERRRNEWGKLEIMILAGGGSRC